ncbi:hypothetical protein QBC44DRAFT_122313 [Cladorrhinum sp. PSN332]|nr:hypothetical protein QBC44DRAFT_122313 [Cladorrhinum sp. PSN332]
MATLSSYQESDSEVEILVHIGAPSLGPDDAKYRALAAAYSNFKPAARIKMPLRGSASQNQKPISDTQFSFEGVDDNHASFVSLPSEVQDSMPDNLATFPGYDSPSRVLDFYTSSLESDTGSSQTHRGVLAKVSQVRGAGSLPSDDEGSDGEGPEAGSQAEDGFKTPPPGQGTPPDKSSSSPRTKFPQYLPEDRAGRRFAPEPEIGVPPPKTSSSPRGPPPDPPMTSSERRRLYPPPTEHTGNTPPSAQPRKVETGITTTEDESSPSLPRSTRRDYHAPSRASQRTPTARRRDDPAPPSSSGQEEEDGEGEDHTRRVLFSSRRPRKKYPRDEIEPTDSDEPSVPVTVPRKRQRADDSSQGRQAKKPRTGAAPDPDEPDGDDDDIDDGNDDSTLSDSLLKIPTTPQKQRAVAKRFAELPLNQEIYAFGPLPPIKQDRTPLSTLDLSTTLLTQVMKFLKPRDRYNPLPGGRKLRHFERGYWIVDVRNWSDDLRRSFWNFLSEYVVRGMGGWGVTAVRDSVGESFTWLRLYGWGYLTCEMYMLLYLTSQRAVRGVGLRWYDAKHRAVVVMPTVTGGGPTGAQVRPGGPQAAPSPPEGEIPGLWGEEDPEQLAEKPEIPAGTTPPPESPSQAPMPVPRSATPPAGQGAQPQQPPVQTPKASGKTADQPIILSS